MIVSIIVAVAENGALLASIAWTMRFLIVAAEAELLLSSRPAISTLILTYVSSSVLSGVGSLSDTFASKGSLSNQT